MADSAPAPGDATTPNRFDPYGPNALADETRQAQMQQANDVPTDVNVNAVVARSQTLTFDMLGKNFEAGAMRFNGLMDHMAAELAKKP